MNFIIGQIISIAALIISVVIAQFKDVKHVLLGEIAANLAVALSFVFLGGMSGAWICIVATAQTIIIFWANKCELAAKKRKILMRHSATCPSVSLICFCGKLQND